MAEEVSLKAGTGRTYQKCEELHGLAIYFERTGKYDDALDVCKQILLEPVRVLVPCMFPSLPFVGSVRAAGERVDR